MQPIQLTEIQFLYLQRIFDCLQGQNQWPTYHELDQWFTCYHEDLDIEEIWKSLPEGLTNYMDLNQPENRAILTVPAISLLKNNQHVLSAFLEVIKRSVDIYKLSPVERPEMSSEMLLQGDPLWWEIGVYKAGLLLQNEPMIWSSFTGPDQSHQWQCTLVRAIRRFRGITTIEDYLEKRDPPRAPASGSLPPSETPVSPGISIPSQQILLHPDIHARCWSFYTQGDYDNAIFTATKAVEIAVRHKAQLPDDLVGANLITQAFKSSTPLLTYSTLGAEQEGMMALLRGMILVYKNPQSHRHVGVQDTSECLAILLMCSNLLYTIDTLSLHEQELSV
jgi:uncharacterized protein (TIGR02391 family)